MKKIAAVLPSQHPLPHQTIGTFNGFTVEVCLSPESLKTACQLRYRAYLAVDAISENKSGLVFDGFDNKPNSFTHLVWDEGRPVATIRSCVFSKHYGWQATEAVGYFPDSIDLHLGEKPSLIESNRFAVDPEFQGRQSLFAQLLLFRVHALNAAIHECKYIITAVREKHVPFYRRFLGMEQISSESKFVAWADSYVALMACDRNKSLATALKRGVPQVTQQDIDQYQNCITSFVDTNQKAA